MIDHLAHVDWKAVGAIAGPSLALLSLLWQAKEKLRRPILASAIYRPSDYYHMDQYWVFITVTGHLINPRPTPIVVEKVTLEAKERRPSRPWQRVVLATNTRLQQIPGAGEDELTVTTRKYMQTRTLRVTVRLRGHHRALHSSWEQDVAQDVVRSVISKNASAEMARIHKMLPPGAYSAPPDDSS